MVQVCDVIVHTEANNHQEDKNVVFLKPPPLTISSDVQRSHSLNRGRKSAPELHPFGRVSARGPQTRSGKFKCFSVVP